MFSQQVQQLTALRGRVPDPVIDAFMAILGQCAQTLVHRGPVSIDVHPDRMRNAPCHIISDGPQAAALIVKAYGGRYTRDPDQIGEGRMCGPAAASFYGTVYIRPKEDNFGLVTKCIDAECVFGDVGTFDEFVVNEVALVNSSRWAVATSNWQCAVNPPSQGGGMGWVTVRECLDSAGNGPFGAEFDVWLPVSPGQDPNVTIGQPLTIQKGGDGTWFSEGHGDDAVDTVKYWAGIEEGDEPPCDGWEYFPDGLEGQVFPTATDDEEHVLDNGGTEQHSHDPHETGDYYGSEIDDHNLAGYTHWGLTGVLVADHEAYTHHDTADVIVGEAIYGEQGSHTHWHNAGQMEMVELGDGESPYHVDVATEGSWSPGWITDLLTSTADPTGEQGNEPFEDGDPSWRTHTTYDYGHFHYLYLEHDVYDPGHRHYFAQILEHAFSLPHTEDSHLPPHVNLRLIRRIDNSDKGVFAGGGP